MKLCIWELLSVPDIQYIHDKHFLTSSVFAFIWHFPKFKWRIWPLLFSLSKHALSGSPFKILDSWTFFLRSLMVFSQIDYFHSLSMEKMVNPTVKFLQNKIFVSYRFGFISLPNVSVFYFQTTGTIIVQSWR